MHLDSLNGVYRCENFAQHVEQNNFPWAAIGLAGGIDTWDITFALTNDENNNPIVYPIIFANNKPTLRLRRFFKVIKQDGSSCFKVKGCQTIISEYGPTGKRMNIAELLNPDNGYLDDNGGLTVEYGIHVEAILGNDGIWKFNFHDKLYRRSQKSRNTLKIIYRDPGSGPEKVLHAHKQLLRFHSPFFQNRTTYSVPRVMEEFRFEECLQMAHGVRISILDYWLILWVAHSNRMRNVIQYADQQLVEKYWSPEEKLSDIMVLEHCIQFELRHLLKHLINHFACLEELKFMIQKLDIQKMSGEAMKTFAAKIFKLKT